MPPDITPEEKLLNLIKANPRQEKKEEEKVDLVLPQSSIASSSLGKEFTVSTTFLNSNLIQKLFITSSVCVVVMLMVLMYQYLGGGAILPLPIKKVLGGESFDLPVRKMGTSETFDSYQKAFQERNLFKTIGTPPPVSISTEKALGLTELSRNLSLSGIISGNTPQAVIEDRSNGQIYYVQSGDSVGPIQVVQVNHSSVLLRYGDEERQLTL